LPSSRRFSFRAGQYVRLSFGPFPPRDYSMANQPGARELEFHIRQMNDDGASAYVGQRLRVGEPVKLEGPFGEAYLREDHNGPILAVAGGSGLAPIGSIVETALAASQDRPVHLYFGVREERDLYMEDRFRALARAHPNFSFVPVLSNPPHGGTRRQGTPDAAVAKDFRDLTGCKAYLAGPPALVEAAVARLLGLGLGEEDIHADPFYGDAEMAARRPGENPPNGPGSSPPERGR
jgi:CDP-4-dehydro-6-deoxyglucose reductase/ferredoxin-NAD(P)+ reductase (naphthalene dioxygenase ferredoxin-specific)